MKVDVLGRTEQADGTAVQGVEPDDHRQDERSPARRRLLAALVIGGTVLVSGILLTADADQDEDAARGTSGTSTEPEPEPEPELPPPATTLLTEGFTGAEGPFVRQADLWDHHRRGGSPSEGPASREAGEDWFAESGAVERREDQGHTRSPMTRMWSTRTDLSFTQAELDITFNGWVGDGSAGWHGVNLWMNRSLCSPVPECTAVDDRGGNSGYALDFVNRDGRLTILKKVPGDTRAQWPEAATSFVQGGTYYELAETRWEPEPGRRYRFGGRVADVADAAVLQVLVDGEVVLEAVDDGSVAGPVLTGGRLGLRSDYADITIDNITVAR